MRKFTTFIIVWGCLLKTGFLNAQYDTVFLMNPSFEANYFLPIENDTIGWVDCGFLSEGPATYQPGQFDVSLAANHLRNYLSMVVRDNYTWDAVGQRLSRPLLAGQCYEITLYLAQARQYISNSHRHEGKVKYNNPLRLLLWGGSGFCQAGQLLAETELVKNKEWQPYHFYFRPERDVTHLTLHAYYLNPMAPAYNGHILIDHASAIIHIPCETAPLPAPPDDNPIFLTPQSIDELERYIALHGKNIVFRPRTTELEEKKDEGLYNPRYWSYAHFSVIVKGMRWFPKRKLVVAIKPHSKKLLEGRIQSIKKFIVDRDLEPSQYELRIYDKSQDKKTRWLSISSDLAIRIE